MYEYSKGAPVLLRKLSETDVTTMKSKLLLLPEPWIQRLQRLVHEGYYANVNEAIRAAIRDLLKFHGKIGKCGEEIQQ